MTLAAVLISGMLQTAKPDQSTEAAARRGRKEKKRTVYASKNKKTRPLLKQFQKLIGTVKTRKEKQNGFKKIQRI